MRPSRIAFLAAFVSLSAFAADPCESPRVRDLAPLVQGVTQDRALAQAFTDAAAACDSFSAACDTAREKCSTALGDTLKAQATLDDGWWLRDMMLSYLGQTYAPGKSLAPGTPPQDVSCQVDAKELAAAGQRRAAQAERRQAILNEYPKYARWANEVYGRCHESAVAEEARAAAAKAEAEKLAAAAATARAAEESRKAAELARQKAAEDEARKQRDAQEEQAKKAKAAQEEQSRQQKQALEDARKKAEEDAKKNADAQDKAARAREEKARRDSEEQIVKDREAKKAAIRKQKEQELAQAEIDARNEEEAAEARRKQVALSAVEQEAADKEAARKRAEARKAKAQGIEVPDDDERSRGALAFMGGAGYGQLQGDEGHESGVFAGGQLIAHLGFWGTAPAAGMATGLEFRAVGRYDQVVTGPSIREITGNVSIRYFTGPLGIGIAGEYRRFDTTLGGVARTANLVAGGPTLGIQMVDNPRERISLNALWLPVGQTIDLRRVVGDLEISHEVITVDITGGLLSDPANPTRFGWMAMGLIGVRLGM